MSLPYASIVEVSVAPDGRATPSSGYGPLFDALWEASSYWWLSCRSLDEVHACCLDRCGAYVAEVLDDPGYGMEQLAADLSEGTGQTSGPDLVDGLKWELVRVYGAIDPGAADGPIYDPDTVKAITEYDYDPQCYPPGWWMGYNTRDQVWMFSHSLDGKPGDGAQWVARLTSGPRYSGLTSNGDGWWYALDSVDNQWKYYRTDDPHGPASQALHDPKGWKTTAEYQKSSTELLADNRHVAYGMPSGEYGKKVLGSTVKFEPLAPEDIEYLRSAGSYHAAIRIPAASIDFALFSGECEIYGKCDQMKDLPNVYYKQVVTGVQIDLRMNSPMLRLLWIVDLSDIRVSAVGGRGNTLRLNKLKVIGLRVLIDDQCDVQLSGGQASASASRGIDNKVEVDKVSVNAVVVEYYSRGEKTRSAKFS